MTSRAAANAAFTRAGVARARRNFRRWRRARPFWGGLLLALSGVEIFLSGNLDPGNLSVKVGEQGFLPYVIPVVLVLCGVLAWVTPQHRLFYGTIGSCVTLVSLVGVNLAGFFVGLVLGIVGGALCLAWTPVPPVAPVASPAPEPRSADAAPADELPADEPPPAGSPRLFVIALVPVTLAAVVLLALQPGVAWADPCLPPVANPVPSTSGPATPEPSRPVSSKPAASKPAASSAAPANVVPPAPVTPNPGAGNHSGNGFVDAITGIVDGIARLFGAGPQPSATPTRPGQSGSPAPAVPAPPAAPAGAAPAVSVPPARPGVPAPPKPAPSRSTSAPALPAGAARPAVAACGPARVLAVDPGQPFVNAAPSLMLADSLAMSGLSFDGVVALPTKTGTVRVLRFSMDKSVSTPFELRVPTPGNRVLSLKSNELTVRGHVRFYTDRFQGNLFGLAPMTFTPDAPPPLILPELEFTNARIQLVYVQSDVLTAPGLHIAPAAVG